MSNKSLADTIEATYLIGEKVIDTAKLNGEITEFERRRLHVMLSTGKKSLKHSSEDKSE